MSGGDLTFTHIPSILHLDESERSPFVLAIKDPLSDLSFVYADFLSHFVKKGAPIVIVDLAQSFHHYNQILLKSGINMKTLREKEKIISIEMLSEFESAINCHTDNPSSVSPIHSNPDGVNSLKALYESIQKGIETVLSKCSHKHFLLLIDEINVLINLGVSVQSLQSFVLNCYSFCAGSSGTLLIGSLLDWDDMESARQVNYFSHICDIKLHVEGLKTGYSKDIQGKISFETKDKAKGTCTRRKMFLRVEDKGAKFLPDGL